MVGWLLAGIMADEPEAKRVKVDSKESFVAAFPGLLAEVLADLRERYPDFDAGAIQWFENSMNFNCPGGKHICSGVARMLAFSCMWL